MPAVPWPAGMDTIDCSVPQGIAEGMSIKLGEMMDQPRHQRIAKLAKEEAALLARGSHPYNIDSPP